MEAELEGHAAGADGHAGPEVQTRRERLMEAAIQAEYATGVHEDTEEQAKRHIIIRLGTIVVGFIVLLGGLAMMVLPGPGVVGILAGLGILSRELPWAERMIEYVKKRAKVEELQQQPVWVQVAMWTFTLLAILASVWWTFIAKPRPELAEILPWNW